MFRDLRQNNRKLLLQADECRMSANILQLYFATNRTKNCLSLTYATDLKCFITVQFYIALTKSRRNKDCTHAINVKAYRTIFVKL